MQKLLEVIFAFVFWIGHTVMGVLPMTPAATELVLRVEGAPASSVSATLLKRLKIADIRGLSLKIAPDGTIRVFAPAHVDMPRLKRLLTRPGKFEIARVVDDKDITPVGLSARVLKDINQQSEYRVAKKPDIVGDVFRFVEAQIDPNDSRPMIAFEMTEAASRDFEALTSANIGVIFAIILDDQVMSAPRIMTPITGGKGMITGSFSMDETRMVADLMSSGQLEAPVSLIEEKALAR